MRQRKVVLKKLFPFNRRLVGELYRCDLCPSAPLPLCVKPKNGSRGQIVSHAEARCARDEVVGLPERSEPEGPQGAARGRDFYLTQSSRSTRSFLEAVSFHYYFADLAYFA